LKVAEKKVHNRFNAASKRSFKATSKQLQNRFKATLRYCKGKL
jgi:hypothetical protein